MIGQKKYRETAGLIATAIQIRVSELNGKIASVICMKDDGCWVFVWTKENRNELLRTFGYLAADPSNGFTQEDAARLTIVVRQIDPVTNSVVDLSPNSLYGSNPTSMSGSPLGNGSKMGIPGGFEAAADKYKIPKKFLKETTMSDEEVEELAKKYKWKPKNDKPPSQPNCSCGLSNEFLANYPMYRRDGDDVLEFKGLTKAGETIHVRLFRRKIDWDVEKQKFTKL